MVQCITCIDCYYLISPWGNGTDDDDDDDDPPETLMDIDNDHNTG